MTPVPENLLWVCDLNNEMAKKSILSIKNKVPERK